MAMLDTGDGAYVEVFSGGSGERPKGSILHFALQTSDCDAATEQARAAGGTITQEPADAVLEGDPPVPVRYSFCALTASRSNCCRPMCSDSPQGST